MTHQETIPLKTNKLSARIRRNAKKSGWSRICHDVDDNKGTYRELPKIHQNVKALNLNKLSQCVADTPEPGGIKK
jgi:hypothetical protein